MVTGEMEPLVLNALDDVPCTNEHLDEPPRIEVNYREKKVIVMATVILTGTAVIMSYIITMKMASNSIPHFADRLWVGLNPYEQLTNTIGISMAVVSFIHFTAYFVWQIPDKSILFRSLDGWDSLIQLYLANLGAAIFWMPLVFLQMYCDVKALKVLPILSLWITAGTACYFPAAIKSIETRTRRETMSKRVAFITASIYAVHTFTNDAVMWSYYYWNIPM